MLKGESGFVISKSLLKTKAFFILEETTLENIYIIDTDWVSS